MATKKAAAAKKVAAPKKAAPKKAAAKTMKPIQETLSKSGLVAHIAGHTEVAPKDVRAVLAALEDTIHASISKKGSGSFNLPGLFKITTKEKPAVRAGMRKNPFTGEMVMGKAKPKSVQVKLRPLKKLKDAAA